ncbi:MAG: hypothetical protein COA36_16835 [Desulfotalea sp.]|nr:MAG: hypothetical protein COA36_16835 [Desulfotalea sp.]
MKRWEYKVILFCDSRNWYNWTLNRDDPIRDEDVSETLNDLGEIGWELINVIGKAAYLKREKKIDYGTTSKNF